jgi:hypothetical protein
MLDGMLQHNKWYISVASGVQLHFQVTNRLQLRKGYLMVRAGRELQLGRNYYFLVASELQLSISRYV